MRVVPAALQQSCTCHTLPLMLTSSCLACTVVLIALHPVHMQIICSAQLRQEQHELNAKGDTAAAAAAAEQAAACTGQAVGDRDLPKAEEVDRVFAQLQAQGAAHRRTQLKLRGSAQVGARGSSML